MGDMNEVPLFSEPDGSIVIGVVLINGRSTDLRLVWGSPTGDGPIPAVLSNPSGHLVLGQTMRGSILSLSWTAADDE